MIHYEINNLEVLFAFDDNVFEELFKVDAAVSISVKLV
jgi:hypothetical protein